MSDTGKDDQQEETPDVEVFERINRLKIKVTGNEKGLEGQIDPSAIEEADQKIASLCEDCASIIKVSLDAITSDWSKMRDMEDGEERQELANKIFLNAHEAKDIGSMCRYDLIAFFAESLRDYIKETDLRQDAHSIIVQAHVDAMNTAFKQGITVSGGPLAEELKALVKQAIDKYS